MSGIEKNRVFDKAAIMELKEQAHILLACAMEVTEELREEMAQLRDIAASVPEEARYAPLESAAASLENSLATQTFEAMKAAITETLDKLAGLIPAYDQANGNILSELSSSTHALKGRLEDLTGLIQEGSLQLSLEDFSEKLETYEKNWNTGVLTLAEKMELAMTLLKGLVLTSMFSRDPVNLSTGNFYYEKEDLRINGLLPLVFKRSYNALDRQRGSLGYGWSHNYEIHLSVSNLSRQNLLQQVGEKNTLTLHKEDGQEITFKEIVSQETTSQEITSQETILPTMEATGKNTGSSPAVLRIYQSPQLGVKIEKTEAGYRYHEKDGHRYSFDESGLLIGEEDESGNRLLFTHDSRGRLTKAEAEAKGEGQPPYFLYTYKDDGALKEVTDHTGRQISFFYIEGRLTEVTGPEGHILCYRYEGNGKIRAVKNPRGILTVRNEYDDKDRVIRQKFPDKGEMTYEYHDTQNRVVLTERNGSQIIYDHDGKLRNTRTRYEDGSSEEYDYNDRNQRTCYQDRNGNETRYQYDETGNLTGITNALGEETALTYNEEGKLLSIEADEKAIYQNHYDKTGKLISREDPLGRTREISYDETGLPVSIRQEDGSLIKLTYDHQGNPASITDPYGARILYTYDDLNRVIRTTDGEGNTTCYRYDRCDRITEVTNPEGNRRAYTYNESGKVTRVEDFDKSAVTIDYNNLNKPERITDKEGRVTQREYDLMWNLKKETGPTGVITCYHYDQNNRLEGLEILPGEGKEAATVFTYTHDPAGNLTHTTGGGKEQNLQETAYEYDALNRCTAITDSTGGKTTYEYDSRGNLTAITDPAGNRRTFSYNAAGELIEEADTNGSGNFHGNTTRYTYNALGKVETVTHPTGMKTTYTYQPGGRLSKVTYPDGRFLTYTYDRNGNVKTKTDREGNSLTLTCDCMDRVVKVTGSAGQEKSYTYDPLGNVTTFTDALGNKTLYSYSLSGKITEVTDALGNRTTYRYDSGDNLIHICREGEGEIQESRYTYNALRQLECAYDALGREEQYAYDSLGRMIKKTDRDGFETVYVYTPDGKPERILYGDGMDTSREVTMEYTPLRPSENLDFLRSLLYFQAQSSLLYISIIK